MMQEVSKVREPWQQGVGRNNLLAVLPRHLKMMISQADLHRMMMQVEHPEIWDKRTNKGVVEVKNLCKHMSFVSC